MGRVVLEGTGIIVRLAGTPELRRDIEEWRNSKCSEHPRTEWRRRPTANGGFQVRRQCLDCGYILGGSRKQTPEDHSLPEADLDAHDAYEALKQKEYDLIEQKHAMLQHSRESSFFNVHNAYLSSPAWQAKRKLVMQRAKEMCEGCGLNKATEVHHLSYRHHMNEFLFELVAVCGECHDRLHTPETEPTAPVSPQDVPDSIDDDGEPPCCDCRWSGFQGDSFWCHQFEITIAHSMSEGGPCGPKRSSLDPLR